jgi:hypothetical protein
MVKKHFEQQPEYINCNRNRQEIGWIEWYLYPRPGSESCLKYQEVISMSENETNHIRVG